MPPGRGSAAGCKFLALPDYSQHGVYVSASAFFYLRDAVREVIATATWLAGWLGGCPSHSGIVSKRLNLSLNFFDHLKAPSFWFLETHAPVRNSKETPPSGAFNTRGWEKIGDFRVIFDGHRRLSRKRCEIGRWLLWNVNGKSVMGAGVKDIIFDDLE